MGKRPRGNPRCFSGYLFKRMSKVMDYLGSILRWEITNLYKNKCEIVFISCIRIDLLQCVPQDPNTYEIVCDRIKNKEIEVERQIQILFLTLIKRKNIKFRSKLELSSFFFFQGCTEHSFFSISNQWDNTFSSPFQFLSLPSHTT